MKIYDYLQAFRLALLVLKWSLLDLKKFYFPLKFCPISFFSRLKMSNFMLPSEFGNETIWSSFGLLVEIQSCVG